uniref:Uncharacterized protein n=1 Tax=Chromera velia CCMP2878 TaxID=1169474 RepID=A0A0G4I3A2_9ALVE|eukprot:Cvel_10603.t1-p1 / transcript=Cvel_10603.t1 / gene=Cvel_10603 / organism=Chromera_velia_CCMP2878 / gene_product=hypothetical protein / transcript_product=hypothetical protein / location=Cvel_scaffold643:25321-28428(-) / protein_length=1036 / sequence_SO=supercontig / SO=protein_coding / is_pseudo=false
MGLSSGVFFLLSFLLASPSSSLPWCHFVAVSPDFFLRSSRRRLAVATDSHSPVPRPVSLSARNKGKEDVGVSERGKDNNVLSAVARKYLSEKELGWAVFLDRYERLIKAKSPEEVSNISARRVFFSLCRRHPEGAVLGRELFSHLRTIGVEVGEVEWEELVKGLSYLENNMETVFGMAAESQGGGGSQKPGRSLLVSCLRACSRSRGGWREVPQLLERIQTLYGPLWVNEYELAWVAYRRAPGSVGGLAALDLWKELTHVSEELEGGVHWGEGGEDMRDLESRALEALLFSLSESGLFAEILNEVIPFAERWGIRLKDGALGCVMRASKSAEGMSAWDVVRDVERLIEEEFTCQKKDRNREGGERQKRPRRVTSSHFQIFVSALRRASRPGVLSARLFEKTKLRFRTLGLQEDEKTSMATLETALEAIAAETETKFGREQGGGRDEEENLSAWKRIAVECLEAAASGWGVSVPRHFGLLMRTLSRLSDIVPPELSRSLMARLVSEAPPDTPPFFYGDALLVLLMLEQQEVSGKKVVQIVERAVGAAKGRSLSVLTSGAIVCALVEASRNNPRDRESLCDGALSFFFEWLQTRRLGAKFAVESPSLHMRQRQSLLFDSKVVMAAVSACGYSGGGRVWDLGPAIASLLNHVNRRVTFSLRQQVIQGAVEDGSTEGLEGAAQAFAELQLFEDGVQELRRRVMQAIEGGVVCDVQKRFEAAVEVFRDVSRYEKLRKRQREKLSNMLFQNRGKCLNGVDNQQGSGGSGAPESSSVVRSCLYSLMAIAVESPDDSEESAREALDRGFRVLDLAEEVHERGSEPEVKGELEDMFLNVVAMQRDPEVRARLVRECAARAKRVGLRVGRPERMAIYVRALEGRASIGGVHQKALPRADVGVCANDLRTLSSEGWRPGGKNAKIKEAAIRLKGLRGEFIPGRPLREYRRKEFWKELTELLNERADEVNTESFESIVESWSGLERGVVTSNTQSASSLARSDLEGSPQGAPSLPSDPLKASSADWRKLFSFARKAARDGYRIEDRYR